MQLISDFHALLNDQNGNPSNFQDEVWKKLNGWKEKVFSQTIKKTLFEIMG